MPYQRKDLTFAICAYKETKYLDDCIQSLISQTQHSNIIMCTSTPNPFIKSLADKYQIPLFINEQPSGLAPDWNFALSCVKTPLATLCHQDDYYFPEYADKILYAANKAKNLLIAFTNYKEDKEGKVIANNLNLIVKKAMNFPLRFIHNNKFIRRRVLSIGNPICCPSVTFNLDNLAQPIFDPTFKNAADWDAWERISKMNGSFVYCKEYLMAHRVHNESTTTQNIQSNVRGKEDLIMLERFWPSWIAKILARTFKLSEKSNQL